MAFLLPLLPEIGIGAVEVGSEVAVGAESLFGGLFGASEATAAVASEVPVAAAVAETSIIPSAAVVAAPELDAGVAAESSSKTLWSKLPKLSMTQKVVGGALAVDGAGHLAQNIGDPHQTLKEAFMNTPGGVVKSATKLADYSGKQVGTIVGSGVKGASEGLFGNQDVLWEVALAAGAFYLFTR